MNRKVSARPRGIAFKSSSLLVAIVIALGSLLGVALPATVATISTGSLLVTVKTCEQDVSGMTNEDQIRSLCSGSLQGSSVGLSFPEGGTQYSQLNDQSAGQFAFSIVGPYVLIAPQVAGFPNAVGTCTSGNDFGGGRTPLGLRFGPEYSFDVPDAGTRVQCTMWLYASPNDPGPPEKQQTVYLQALSCASDLSNTVDPGAMAADCLTALPGVEVTLADEAGDSLTTVTDSNGMTRFSVPTGALSLSVAIPDQFSGGWKVCNQFDEKSNPVSGPEIHPLTDGAGAPVTISSPGYIAKCLVYLYTGTQREPGISGRIFLCDTDLSDVTLDQFQALNPASVCAQVATNTRVVIQDVVTQTSQELTSAGDGTFLFPTRTNGNFQVVPVTQSSIYTSMLGFCQFLTPQLAVEATDFQQTTPNGGMPVNIRESSPIANCQFLIYDPSQAKPGEIGQPGDTTTAEIRVAARLCPSGFSSSNFDQLDATCPASPDPINFTAGGQGKTSINGDFATFPGLTPGSITVTEETPDGFGQAVVFCGKTNVGSNDLPVSTQRTVVGGNTVTFTIGGGDLELCTWFNTTEPVVEGTGEGNGGQGTNGSGTSSDTATLIIVLKTCPMDYNPDSAKADPEKECTRLTDNVNISATSKDNNKKRRQTGETEPGTSIYEGLTSGIYRLHQGYPKGVKKAFVLECESDKREFNYPYIPFARIDETGSIKIDIQAPETLTCSWFNVPTSDDEESQDDSDFGDSDSELETVTITVLTCSGIPNASACDPADQGFGVSLKSTDTSGSSIDVETDENGIATIRVSAGSYSIDADDPPCFMNSSASNPGGGIDVTSGQTVSVELLVCT